jgi:hypothetical protein
MFETHSEFFIPQIGTQLSRPPVLIRFFAFQRGLRVASRSQLGLPA